MNSTNRINELKKFGYAVGGVVFVIGAIDWRLSGQVYIHLMSIATILIISGIFKPQALALAYMWWMKFANVMNVIMTTILLSFVFFVIVTPIALFFRIVGKRPIDLSFGSKGDSYWQKMETQSADYAEKQF